MKRTFLLRDKKALKNRIFTSSQFLLVYLFKFNLKRRFNRAISVKLSQNKRNIIFLIVNQLHLHIMLSSHRLHRILL